MQISRVLNPTDREDRDYLIGLPAGQQLAADENWFAVFMRVQNDERQGRSRPPTATRSRTRRATIYSPITMGPENVFAYRPASLQPKDILPLPDTPAAREHDPGLDAAVQDPGRELPEPPARARRSRLARSAAARPARSTSTCASRGVGAVQARPTPSAGSAVAFRPEQDVARRGRRGVAAGPRADEQHADRDRGRPVPAGA